MFAYIFFIRFNKMIYNATTELVGTFFNIFRFFVAVEPDNYL